MKVVRWLLGGVLLLVAAVVMALFVADRHVASRMLAMPFGGSLGPVETIPGGPGPDLPVAPVGQRTIRPEALQAAIDYGAATNSHALLVWHAGALQLEHYYAGYDRDTRTPTQSMHKSVLALLVGTAIRDGYIGSVDDPIGRYLPEWAADPRGQVTVRQLLQQASGIGFPKTNYLNPAGDFLQVMMGAELERTLLAQPVELPPNTQFDYQNVNAGLLGLVLERAVRRPYSRYLAEALWQPLGAAPASVVVDSTEHRTPRVFCCLDATARSWLQLGLLHLQAGAWNGVQVVPREWMVAVAAPSAQNPNYGYMTWLGTTYHPERRYNHKSEPKALQSERYAAPDVRYFDGFGGQRVYIIPSRDLVIVRTGDLALNWDDARLPNLLIAGVGGAGD
jgi:CubicO group peptidase (beta-lactamase class C family)